MALNLRHKQIECVIRMLNLNQPLDPNGSANEEIYKIIIYDDICEKIIAPLMLVKDLRRQGVTLQLPIHKERLPVPAVAVYFVQATETNIQRIIADASRSLYDTLYLNFSSSIPRPLLEGLASGTFDSGCVERVAKVHDQYLEFVTLEDNLFSLAQQSVYVQLNHPSATDKEIEEIIKKIVDGLFCVLATLSVVPVIRCPRGGPAEMVASSLDQKLRDHLLSKTNLFTEVCGGFMSSFQRPLLCIFDRNFELSVGIQHDFRYRPLVHDVLGLKLNSLTLPGDKVVKKTFVGSSDPFWSANGSLEFPQVAVQIEIQLNKYKNDVEEVNMRTGGGTSSAELNEADLIGNTKHLMNAVNSLPELTERKHVIDKHTNIATALLGEIKERSLDAYTKKENDMMMRGGIDWSDLLSVLKGKGTKMDKLRFAIIYLISLETVNQAEVEAVEAALREAEADTSAFQYVKWIKSLNVSLAASANSASRSNIIDWAEKLYGQSISAVTAGVKNLLSSDQLLGVARTVEALAEGKPNPETDSYLMLDPRASKSSSGGSSHMKGPFREAIVFMVGGGNYIEYSSLQELLQRQEMVKNIIYGATEILTGTEFVEQLALLGQKMGLK